MDYVREAIHVDQLSGPEAAWQVRRFATVLRVFHYETSRETVAPHGGPFSLKTVLRGGETFVVGGRRIPVRAGEALLIPRGVVYGSDIGEASETFAGFFPLPIEEELFDDEADPARKPVPLPAFPLVPLRAGPEVVAALSYTRDALRDGDAERGAEFLMIAARQAAARALGLGPALAGLQAARPAVREELLRRVLRARDCIDDNLAQEVGLAQLATVSCLSRFHLLRCFRAAFGETPAQYRLRRRLEAARISLERTEVPVRSIAASLGFASHPAFSRRFRLAFGVTPIAMRSAAARG